MKPVELVLRDMERASLRGELTPSWIEEYADAHRERVAGLYALARRNFLAINIEAGRNDHLLNEWSGSVDADVVSQALDKQAVEVYRRVRASRDDGRPSVLRRKPGRHAAFVPKPQPAPQPVRKVHVCPPGCTCDVADPRTRWGSREEDR